MKKLILLLLLPLVISSCSDTDPIIGTWIASSQNIHRYEFGVKINEKFYSNTTRIFEVKSNLSCTMIVDDELSVEKSSLVNNGSDFSLSEQFYTLTAEIDGKVGSQTITATFSDRFNKLELFGFNFERQ